MPSVAMLPWPSQNLPYRSFCSVKSSFRMLLLLNSQFAASGDWWMMLVLSVEKGA